MFTNTHPFMTGVDLVSAPLRYEGLTWSPHQQHPLSKWGNPSSSTESFKTVDLPLLLLSHGFVQSLLPSLFLSEGRLRFFSRCCRPLLLHHLIIFSSVIGVCVRACVCVRATQNACARHLLAGGWQAGLGNTWSRSMKGGFFLVS